MLSTSTRRSNDFLFFQFLWASSSLGFRYVKQASTLRHLEKSRPTLEINTINTLGQHKIVQPSVCLSQMPTGVLHNTSVFIVFSLHLDIPFQRHFSKKPNLVSPSVRQWITDTCGFLFELKDCQSNFSASPSPAHGGCAWRAWRGERRGSKTLLGQNLSREAATSRHFLNQVQPFLSPQTEC